MPATSFAKDKLGNPESTAWLQLHFFAIVALLGRMALLFATLNCFVIGILVNLLSNVDETIHFKNSMGMKMWIPLGILLLGVICLVVGEVSPHALRCFFLCALLPLLAPLTVPHFTPRWHRSSWPPPT